ncbi:enoyl-CoA hydratase/isomerase family protein [Alkalicoccus urumqiensis]|nr:enoyl-CoA hydratase/isomerase family protein [Alkalicoccus urumqiensis]
MIRRVPDGKITLQEGAKIAVVTINRPEARNALTREMWQELGNVARAVKKRGKSRVLIVRGVPGNFTAGSDIKEFCSMTNDEANDAFQVMEETIALYEEMPIPVIGAIDGPVYGAGFIFSLAFDLRIGTEHTKMGIPVARLGIRLGPAFTDRILYHLGPARLKELVLMSTIYGHETAHQLGLLHQVTSRAELDSTVLAAADRIVHLSAGSVQAVKQAVPSFRQPEEAGAWAYADPQDFHEGCTAFRDKRAPAFQERGLS